MSGDYFNLCGNCGTIRRWSDFTLLQRDIDSGELRPAREGEMDPIVVCPVCDWHHTDDDSGPGLWDGTEFEVTRIRGELIVDPVWAEAWADNEVDRLLDTATAAKAALDATPRRRVITRWRLEQEWLGAVGRLDRAERQRQRLDRR